MSKYIDLAPEIEGLLDPMEVRAGIRVGLSWLDSHPDQVPGQTITESEYDRQTDPQSNDFVVGFDRAMALFGNGVVPDPEPTNAEKLEMLFADLMKCQMTYKQAAAQMDMLGVKAPGGDDE